MAFWREGLLFALKIDKVEEMTVSGFLDDCLLLLREELYVRHPSGPNPRGQPQPLFLFHRVHTVHFWLWGLDGVCAVLTVLKGPLVRAFNEGDPLFRDCFEKPFRWFFYHPKVEDQPQCPGM